ncbi:MAG TPA: SMP-30/gluconolactonase/LRE family protein [Verrucomicrobiales bacterium]|nr:SMP-30/gluconolactonase/LRE family protein [Verrucomicrobiales bacterium]
MTESPAVECVAQPQARLGEGPCWHAGEGVLYWVDILGPCVRRFDPRTGEDMPVARFEERVGAVVPRTQGGFLVALENGMAFLDLPSGRLERLPPVDPRPTTRFNDGKCDPQGRFWAGTMDLGEKDPIGALYRIDPDGAAHCMTEGVAISNGLAWSADSRTLYYIDSPTRTVRAYDFNPETGAISAPRAALRLGEGDGFPDGMTIDAEGKLWVAQWGGACVSRWDPDTAERLARIEVPAPHTTSCCFGGPDFGDLYITSARVDLDEETLARFPLSGSLFRVRPGVCGGPSHTFTG